MDILNTYSFDNQENNKGNGVRDTFFMFPKWVQMLSVSSNTKIVYVMILDRFKMSKDNKWKDEVGNAYCIYKIEKLEKITFLSRQTVINSINELREMGLIVTHKTGFNRPNQIYVIEPNKNLIKKLDEKYKEIMEKDIDIIDAENDIKDIIQNEMNYDSILISEAKETKINLETKSSYNQDEFNKKEEGKKNRCLKIIPSSENVDNLKEFKSDNDILDDKKLYNNSFKDYFKKINILYVRSCEEDKYLINKIKNILTYEFSNNKISKEKLTKIIKKLDLRIIQNISNKLNITEKLEKSEDVENKLILEQLYKFEEEILISNNEISEEKDNEHKINTQLKIKEQLIRIKNMLMKFGSKEQIDRTIQNILNCNQKLRELNYQELTS